MTRDERQQAIYMWTYETFGADAIAPGERALRLIEEVVELAQAEGLSKGLVEAIVKHVYAKPLGQPIQEAGGVGLCLLAYCAARGFSADSAEMLEFKRVESIDPEVFRVRHNKKADAGIAVRVPQKGTPPNDR